MKMEKINRLKAEAALLLWSKGWTIEEIAKAVSKPKTWVEKLVQKKVDKAKRFREQVKRARRFDLEF